MVVDWVRDCEYIRKGEKYEEDVQHVFAVHKSKTDRTFVNSFLLLSATENSSRKI